MNCIDAVEGTAKRIITDLFQRYVRERQDDSEYLQTLKTVIHAAVDFVVQNPELMQSPDILRDVLAAYAKELWLGFQQARVADDAGGEKPQNAEEQSDYLSYYYDYIFEKGEYPL